jgi:hypothetical protein
MLIVYNATHCVIYKAILALPNTVTHPASLPTHLATKLDASSRMALPRNPVGVKDSKVCFKRLFFGGLLDILKIIHSHKNNTLNTSNKKIR